MQQVLSQVLVPARHHRSPLQLLLGQQGLPGFQPLLLLDQLLHLQVQSLGLQLRDPKLLAAQQLTKLRLDLLQLMPVLVQQLVTPRKGSGSRLLH